MKIISLVDNLNKVIKKTVLLRLDLNVTMSGAKIINDYKLRVSLPTIKFLQHFGCKVIIITHLGEPVLAKKSLSDKKFSTKPLANWLSKKLNHEVKLLPYEFSKIKTLITKAKPGDVLMFQNIRLFKGEMTNDKSLAKKLANLAQVYINDAFAVSHRSQASVDQIKNYLPSLAGPLLIKEVTNLAKAQNGQQPLVLIMGGAKLSTKLPLLKKLAPHAKLILTGGGIANTILKIKGFKIGKSLFDQESLTIAKKLNLKKIILPVDVAVLSHNKRLEKNLDQLKNNDCILDIGAKTVKLYVDYLKKAKTIIWNGPLGLFENKNFSQSTNEIAKIVSQLTSKGAFSLIGGGETVTAIKKYQTKFSWVSTGGGASLVFLSGKNMPGLNKLVKK